MTANSSSCAALMASCDHSILSSERCEKLDSESTLGCGWGAYGEGIRMTVPGEAKEVLRIERKAAEVDWRRFGGVKDSGLDCLKGKKRLERTAYTIIVCTYKGEVKGRG